MYRTASRTKQQVVLYNVNVAYIYYFYALNAVVIQDAKTFILLFAVVKKSRMTCRYPNGVSLFISFLSL
jgi:hypothetical protein